MNPLHGQGNIHKIINILRNIPILATLGSLKVERSLDREIYRLGAPVAKHRNLARDIGIQSNLSALFMHDGMHFKVSIENLRILEVSKELFISTPIKCRTALR